MLGAQGLLAGLLGPPGLLHQPDLLGLELGQLGGWRDRPAVDHRVGEAAEVLQLVEGEDAQSRRLEAGLRVGIVDQQASGVEPVDTVYANVIDRSYAREASNRHD